MLYDDEIQKKSSRTCIQALRMTRIARSGRKGQIAGCKNLFWMGAESEKERAREFSFCGRTIIGEKEDLLQYELRVNKFNFLYGVAFLFCRMTVALLGMKTGRIMRGFIRRLDESQNCIAFWIPIFVALTYGNALYQVEFERHLRRSTNRRTTEAENLLQIFSRRK